MSALLAALAAAPGLPAEEALPPEPPAPRIFARAAAPGDRDGDGLSDEEERFFGTLPQEPDTDGDGLLDGWEVYGVNRYGFFEPLQHYGADPLRKDIFVEIDWMESGTSSAVPEAGPHASALIAYQAACDIYRLFRDSGTGIAIHFDLGPAIEELIPEKYREDDCPDFSRFGRHPDPVKMLPRENRFPVRPPCEGVAGVLSLYDVYNDPRYFRPSRRNLFYYVLIAERHDPETPWAGGRRGFTDSFADERARAAGLKPAGVQVSVIFRLPEENLSDRERRYKYSASILHELGHGFGLGHGGATPDGRWDNRNNKPNYPSIMNHRYQFWGVDLRDGARVMDFSRGSFKAVVETMLFEPAGLGAVLPNPHILENIGVEHLKDSSAPYNIDWNRNGVVDEKTVHEDLDFNGRLDAERFRDHDDWGKMVRDGFSGIGTHAFFDCGLSCQLPNEWIRVPGDFDGDGMEDFVLFTGDVLSLVRSKGDGTMEIPRDKVLSGRVGAWELSLADQIIVGDVDGNGREEVLLHRGDAALLMDFSGEGARVMWSGRSVAAGWADAAGAEKESWGFDPGDRLEPLRLAPEARKSILSTNHDRVAVLGWREGDFTLSWTAGESLRTIVEDDSLAVRGGRYESGRGGTLFARGLNSLVEFDARADGYPARRIDAGGIIPWRTGDEGGWEVSWKDCLVPVDLDGDGNQEILIRSAERVGVLREFPEGLFLVWTSDRVAEPWAVQDGDQVRAGQFLAGGGEEVIVSYTRGGTHAWMALSWNDAASALERIAVARGEITDPSGERPPFSLRRDQRAFTGAFVEGEPLLLAVWDGPRMLVARLSSTGFEQVAVHEERIGAWSFGGDEQVIVANADADGADELLVKQASLFGVLKIGPRASAPFIAEYDPVSRSFQPPEVFLRGDANRDESVDITDALTILYSLFLGEQRIRCKDAADVDDNGELDISDPIRLLDYLFIRGEPLAPPGAREPGTDPTQDALDCEIRK